MRPLIATIGHSTRTFAELVDLLRAHEVTALVDIRRFPGSRRNPQFNSEALAEGLPPVGIAYRHEPRLGGRRKANASTPSPNEGWRNEGFRAFADAMQTAEFAEALVTLLALARESRVAIMCAEAVPWRCHRSLVADALHVHGADVRHITGPGPAAPHRLTSFARVEGNRITYPPPESLELPLEQ